MDKFNEIRSISEKQPFDMLLERLGANSRDFLSNNQDDDRLEDIDKTLGSIIKHPDFTPIHAQETIVAMLDLLHDTEYGMDVSPNMVTIFLSSAQSDHPVLKNTRELSQEVLASIASNLNDDQEQHIHLLASDNRNTPSDVWTKLALYCEEKKQTLHMPNFLR